MFEIMEIIENSGVSNSDIVNAVSSWARSKCNDMVEHEYAIGEIMWRLGNIASEYAIVETASDKVLVRVFWDSDFWAIVIVSRDGRVLYAAACLAPATFYTPANPQ